MMRTALIAGLKAASLAAASRSAPLATSWCAGAAVASQHSLHKLWRAQLPQDAQFRSFAAAAAQPEPVRHEHDEEEHKAEGVHMKKMPTYDQGFVAPHKSMKTTVPMPEMLPIDVHNVMNSPAYTMEYMESITPKHIEPTLFSQQLAYYIIQTVRKTFDWVTGYGPEMTEQKWLQRMLFLETVAGVPGMVGGMLRHLKSLRTMEPDHGWINTLLDEAENERLHLLTFMQLREPGLLFRGMVILAQGVFFNAFFISYLLSPKTCHAAVGYLEEEAVKTYTHALKDIDEGRLWAGKKAPAIARSYWKLPEDATMRELILAIRADEACHSHVNHTFARIKQTDTNPFGMKGAASLP